MSASKIRLPNERKTSTNQGTLAPALSLKALVSKSTNSGAALTVRYIWQSLHRGALVVCREMRVLARDCGALVPHNFARDKV